MEYSKGGCMAIGVLTYPGQCHYWTGYRLLSLEQPMYSKTLYMLYDTDVAADEIWRIWVEDDQNRWR